VSIRLSHLDDGLLLTVHALGELTVLDRLSTHVDGEHLAVVVDVSEMTMAPQGDVEQLVDEVCHAAVQGEHRWSVVSTRVTARRILRQRLDGTGVAVHSSIDAALLASRPVAEAT